MPEVYVGCGSNIEPESNLRWALEALGARVGPLARSTVYASPALGFAGPDFLNLVLGFESEAGPDAIEAILSELENGRGRGAGDRDGSRSLDLDLLFYGASVDAARRLPRVDVLRYPFVLAPLAEIAPEFVHPVTGASMRAAWRRRAEVPYLLTPVSAL
jgi:2-amino-4-hydroxy-6-hydroxymethyldihydropteridine diphosphokinase